MVVPGLDAGDVLDGRHDAGSRGSDLVGESFEEVWLGDCLSRVSVSRV